MVIGGIVGLRLDEWEDLAEENLKGVLKKLPAPALAKNIVGRIGAKTGAGLTNYILAPPRKGGPSKCPDLFAPK